MTTTKKQKIAALHKMKSDYGAVMSCIEDDWKDNYVFVMPYFTSPRMFGWDKDGNYSKVKGYQRYLYNKNTFLQGRFLRCQAWIEVTKKHIQWLKDEIDKLEKELYYF